MNEWTGLPQKEYKCEKEKSFHHVAGAGVGVGTQQIKKTFHAKWTENGKLRIWCCVCVCAAPAREGSEKRIHFKHTRAAAERVMRRNNPMPSSSPALTFNIKIRSRGMSCMRARWTQYRDFYTDSTRSDATANWKYTYVYHFTGGTRVSYTNTYVECRNTYREILRQQCNRIQFATDKCIP